MSSRSVTVSKCTIELVRGDITEIPVDAIVNAANTKLVGGGGVDGAIHLAGGPTLMQELRKYSGCATGSAVVTGAGRLPAKYVIHAVGPVYRGGGMHEAELLASCYETALKLAVEYDCKSISFPAISTGIYGYPMSEAAAIALSAIIGNEALNSLETIKLVQFNESGYAVYSEMMGQFAARKSSAQTGYD